MRKNSVHTYSQIALIDSRENWNRFLVNLKVLINSTLFQTPKTLVQ